MQSLYDKKTCLLKFKIMVIKFKVKKKHKNRRSWIILQQKGSKLIFFMYRWGILLFKRTVYLKKKTTLMDQKL